MPSRVESRRVFTMVPKHRWQPLRVPRWCRRFRLRSPQRLPQTTSCAGGPGARLLEAMEDSTAQGTRAKRPGARAERRRRRRFAAAARWQSGSNLGRRLLLDQAPRHGQLQLQSQSGQRSTERSGTCSRDSVEGCVRCWLLLIGVEESRLCVFCFSQLWCSFTSLDVQVTDMMVRLYESITKNNVASAEALLDLDKANTRQLIADFDNGSKQPEQALTVLSYRRVPPPDAIMTQVCCPPHYPRWFDQSWH